MDSTKLDVLQLFLKVCPGGLQNNSMKTACLHCILKRSFRLALCFTIFYIIYCTYFLRDLRFKVTYAISISPFLVRC